MILIETLKVKKGMELTFLGEGWGREVVEECGSVGRVWKCGPWGRRVDRVLRVWG